MSFPITTLARREGALFLEDVALENIAAGFGSPTYVYSRAALEAAYTAWSRALQGKRARVFYAVKANSNIAILQLFARLGAGFDIVSGGELARVLAAGASASDVVFSGVGKSEGEMRQALAAGVRCFNIESEPELLRLEAVAKRMGLRAPIAFRVNPDVDPKTHPYISTGLKNNKFGVAFDEALRLYRYAAASAHLAIDGIACHIGSQMLERDPIADAGGRVLELIAQLNAEGITLKHIDLGGGLGIRYRDEVPPAVSDYLGPLLAKFAGRSEELCFEPGRSLVGNAGLLLTRVEYVKHGESRHFAIVDAAMNDLARPALYEAYHEIVPVAARELTPHTYDVVGPVCESGDFLGLERELAIQDGDLLAVLSAGAYGMAMASNYNTRGRAAEVLVDGEAVHLIRERETVDSLFAAEKLLP
ncbi:diaminopimelate decarboxylase [Niveibacterium sp. SC-1]|uniref:diaminopimelate decarboxylase n=1 Tax=Niveibacterium sp. SC-1 TaxID=3135646 RepID=UPI00311E4154